MKIALVTTGDEIMSGQVIDTNAGWMSEKCWNIGAKVVWRLSVMDDEKSIGEACRLAAERADIVLVSGGLGPTADDITLPAAAKAFGKDIEKTGKAIPNKVGTAPGCEMQLGKALFYFLPGVPKELYPMFDDFVLPAIREKLGGVYFAEKIFHCFGAREAALDTALKGVSLGDLRLSFRVRFPEVLLKIALWGKEKEKVDAALERGREKIHAKVGEFIYGEGETSLAKVIGELLLRKKATLSLAESCTGGAIATAITDVSGASRYFERGVVVYSNRSKSELLGVSKETLEKWGAVSEEIAKAMADGIRKSAKTTYGLSVTGIAGPTGGTKEKPVGTVYIGLATPKSTVVKQFCFQRDRLEFKQLVTATALNILRQTLL